MFKVASWNLNSVRSRLTHVTAWLKLREPDVLLLQELKGTEFPSEAFKSLGYESVAVTQKAYNGVAILSRHPVKTIAKSLVGDDSDSHARFLEVIIRDIRVVNVYLPNGNPVGSASRAPPSFHKSCLVRKVGEWLSPVMISSFLGAGRVVLDALIRNFIQLRPTSLSHLCSCHLSVTLGDQFTERLEQKT